MKSVIDHSDTTATADYGPWNESRAVHRVINRSFRDGPVIGRLSIRALIASYKKVLIDGTTRAFEY